MKKIIDKIISFIVNIPYDKILHLFAGYVIAHVVNSSYYAIFTPSYGGSIAGFIVAFLVGILKEVYDYYNRKQHSVELMDLKYTTLGGFISSIISLISLL